MIISEIEEEMEEVGMEGPEEDEEEEEPEETEQGGDEALSDISDEMEVFVAAAYEKTLGFLLKTKMCGSQVLSRRICELPCWCLRKFS